MATDRKKTPPQSTSHLPIRAGLSKSGKLSLVPMRLKAGDVGYPADQVLNGQVVFGEWLLSHKVVDEKKDAASLIHLDARHPVTLSMGLVQRIVHANSDYTMWCRTDDKAELRNRYTPCRLFRKGGEYKVVFNHARSFTANAVSFSE